MEFLPEEIPLSFIVGKDEDSKDIIPASTLVPELNQLHLYMYLAQATIILGIYRAIAHRRR